MRTTLLIPTLNEADALPDVMPKIDRSWVDQILFVNGGSQDGTLDYVRKHNYEFFVQQKPGIRNAYIEAMGHVSGDVVITFSPDGNSMPDLIPPLVAKMKEGYDMVIVSRYLEGAKSRDDDIVTAFGNWLFRCLINIVHNTNYTDPMVMYRAWRKEIFAALDLDKDASYEKEERLFHTRVGCEPLLSIRVARHKLKWTEIPGDEPPRIGGVRKLQIIRWGCAYLYEVIRERFA